MTKYTSIFLAVFLLFSCTKHVHHYHSAAPKPSKPAPENQANNEYHRHVDMIESTCSEAFPHDRAKRRFCYDRQKGALDEIMELIAGIKVGSPAEICMKQAIQANYYTGVDTCLWTDVRDDFYSCAQSWTENNSN